jgi:hypothetical protein
LADGLLDIAPFQYFFYHRFQFPCFSFVPKLPKGSWVHWKRLMFGPSLICETIQVLPNWGLARYYQIL